MKWFTFLLIFISSTMHAQNDKLVVEGAEAQWLYNSLRRSGARIVGDAELAGVFTLHVRRVACGGNICTFWDANSKNPSRGLKLQGEDANILSEILKEADIRHYNGVADLECAVYLKNGRRQATCNLTPY